MNYEETLKFLFNQLPAYHRIGKAAYKSDLENSIALDNYFGNPHLKFQAIHVAGTNGKGSVSHMTASVLQEAGFKTGLYTSPHLQDFRERIKINGVMIDKDEIVTFVTKHIAMIETLQPSFFELSVALAFDYFAEKKVDIAVIEVGLGGRLDSTNIITPVLSVITNIGHDHMDLLGETLEKVAYEKAGIIKNDIPVVISETQLETAGVFKKRADEAGSEIKFADMSFSCSLEEDGNTDSGRMYNIRDSVSGLLQNGFTPLGGDYQAKNIQCVFQIFRTLKGKFEVSDENITRGIAGVVLNTGLTGRWQILSKNPLTICDTGHNKEGLEYVMRQLERLKKKRLLMVVGFVNDKDLSSVLPLFPKNAVYYFTRAAVPRALDENVLKSKASEYGLHGSAFPLVKSALEEARKNACTDDIIFIGGSTFVVGDAL